MSESASRRGGESARWPDGDRVWLRARLAAPLCAVLLSVFGRGAAGQEQVPSELALTPVTDLRAGDVPDDDGKAVYLTWPCMPYDRLKDALYVVEIAPAADGRPVDGGFREVARFAANTHWKSDHKRPFWMWRGERDVHYVEISSLPPAEPSAAQGSEAASASAPPAQADGAGGQTSGALQRGHRYHLRVAAVRGDQRTTSQPVETVPRANWFDWTRLNNLFYVLLFGGILMTFLEVAKRRQLFLRRIPGLAAIDEAIGRATEMGRRVIYMTGRHDVDRPSTIAACLILGDIAKRTATYDVQLRVPHSFSVTMSICQEITKEAYLEAGRPDAYREEMNYYITEDQFSYAAAVNGDMLRNPPGAVIYMGYYYAESLFMAEAAAETGAIQVAGTDSESQLPFFVVACDYTLLGEELYAASAYLSRKPELVGTLRGQDFAKLLIMASLVLGVAAVTGLSLVGAEGLSEALMDLLRTHS